MDKVLGSEKKNMVLGTNHEHNSERHMLKEAQRSERPQAEQ